MSVTSTSATFTAGLVNHIAPASYPSIPVPMVPIVVMYSATLIKSGNTIVSLRRSSTGFANSPFSKWESWNCIKIVFNIGNWEESAIVGKLTNPLRNLSSLLYLASKASSVNSPSLEAITARLVVNISCFESWVTPISSLEEDPFSFKASKDIYWDSIYFNISSGWFIIKSIKKLFFMYAVSVKFFNSSGRLFTSFLFAINLDNPDFKVLILFEIELVCWYICKVLPAMYIVFIGINSM